MAQEKVGEVRSKFTTLYVDPTVMKRIHYYAAAAEGEVSGLGTIIKDDKGRHIVNAVYLLEQESSGADTDLKPEAISKLMIDIMNKNEDPAALKFWWHSHANMGVFWSGTDDTCAETLSREYAFSLVVNKQREMRCRLDLYAPFRITFDGVKVTELVQEDDNLKEECEKEVKEKVRTPTERWKNWHDKDRTPGGYTGYPDAYGYEGYSHVGDKLGWKDKKKEEVSRVTVDEKTASDIERLLTLAERNATDGGIFEVTTWQEYILETLREVFDERFKDKGACVSPGTFDKEYEMCVKDCKISKKCAYWTRFFDETEEDAKDQLAELCNEGLMDSNLQGAGEV
jgi:hypothetical protein